jgi:hypothetical protein
MKKKIKKAQLGGSLFASASKALTVDPTLVKEPVFSTKADFDAYHLKQSLEKLSPEDRQWYNDAVAKKVTNVSPQDIIALRAPTPLYSDYVKSKGKNEPMGNVLGKAYGLKKGGIITDNRGQLAHPGKVTKILSNNITMKGVKNPLLGVSNTGDTKLMIPGNNYMFKGDSVTEFPLGKSGIHIKPENKGKFNALKKRTGKSTEELTHSKNPLTRKRAIFAQNAKKWNKGQDGANLGPKRFLFEEKTKLSPMEQNINMMVLAKGHPEYLPSYLQQPVQYGPKHMLYKPKGQFGTNVQQPIETNWGSENIFVPGQFSVAGQANQFANTLDNPGNVLNDMGGILNIGTSLLGGFQMLGQNREQRREAKQMFKLSELVNQASSLPVDKPKRKYVRPEDQVIDPDTIANSYGTGTNYLQDGGFLEGIDYGRTGNIGQMFGSFIGGGQGIPSGAGQIGSTLGGVAGTLLGGPVGTKIGSFLGGALGGVLGGGLQRDTRRYQQKAQDQLQSAAFQQGSQQIHNQYTGFMQDGGDISTHWGGYADPISVNPYLPGNGQSVLFKGNSHEQSDGKGNTGIGMTFGNTPVEVENGEPAVKLEHGLTVFGDMKIPSYGVRELNDPKAKNKKFKNYVNELNELENKQNKITDESIMAINDNPMATPFDKLKYSSNTAMLTGANMNLKNIANKKKIASDVQNAILQTAEEFNLDSGELAKGNIKKAKMGKRIAQAGDIIPKSISREEAKKWLELGFAYEPNNQNRLFRTINTPGKEEFKTQSLGSKEYQDWFKANYPKNKGKVLDSKWGPQLMQLGDRTTKISYPGSSKTDYIDIFDPTGKLAKIDPINVGNLRVPGATPTGKGVGTGEENFDAMGLVNSILPYLRPTNQRPLDPNQLSGEMFALASNQLDPVQAQLYNPLLEQVSDISLQDQMNANQADFNALQRSLRNNPAALAQLAAQKYQANTGVLGEQFRINQAQRMNTYNKNRATLNDAQLKNLGILDQQYVRQSEAKSKTKAVAQSALESIADKIQRNKLENRTLGIYENLYNYRFGPKGYAYNLNPLFNPDIPQVGEDLPLIDENGVTSSEEYRQKYDRIGNPIGSEKRQKTTKKNKNGGLVRALKGYNQTSY